MALEDVVQGVKVNVTAEGIDEVKSALGQLDKAVGDLSKSADTATGSRGGGGGGGSGVVGLSDAFKDLSNTGAEAFAQIARGVSSGDITGLATLLGGRLGGSVAEAGKAFANFIETQDRVILQNAALAKELGTTPAVVQSLRDGFEGAGVSGAGFERLLGRMSRRISTDYPDMMRNISESNLKARKSALDLEEAQRNLQKTYSDNSG